MESPDRSSWTPESYPPTDREDSDWVDISTLSANEIVALNRLILREQEERRSVGFDLDSTLCHLAEVDIDRAIEIATAFADSPLAEDRMELAAYYPLISLTKANRTAGYTLWERLIADVDRGVRWAAVNQLEEYLVAAAMGGQYQTHGRPTSGMRLVDVLDEDELQDLSGLTREDARSLLEAYAYAEHDAAHRFDLGRVALAKVVRVA